MKLPAATPVIMTVQLPVVRVQLVPTVPIVVSDDVKVTLPDGTFAAFVVSVTDTEQEPVRPTVTDAEQETLVDVSSFTTVIVPEVPVLPLCPGEGLVSPLYVPLTVAVPGATPVNMTVQLPEVVRVQLAPTVPTAVLEDVKVTVPVGVFVEVVVSVTVALQVDAPPMLMLAGLQEIVVEVLSSCAAVTVIVPEVPELPL